MCELNRTFQSTGGESAHRLPKSTAEKREERYIDLYKVCFLFDFNKFFLIIFSHALPNEKQVQQDNSTFW